MAGSDTRVGEWRRRHESAARSCETTKALERLRVREFRVPRLRISATGLKQTAEPSSLRARCLYSSTVIVSDQCRLSIIFLASVSMGNAAAALKLGASEAVTLRQPCQCSGCDNTTNKCVYTEHQWCGFDQAGLCYNGSCPASSQCL